MAAAGAMFLAASIGAEDRLHFSALLRRVEDGGFWGVRVKWSGFGNVLSWPPECVKPL